MEERTSTFDNANAESAEELEKGGIERLQEEWNEGKLQLDLDSTKSFDIGDIVGAKDLVTGTTMQKPIAKKIVTIDKNTIQITHKVGE